MLPIGVKALIKSWGRTILWPGGIPALQYLTNHPRTTTTWLAVNRQRLTYSTPLQLGRLLDEVRRLERAHAAGEIIEAGCALGGSAILMCSAKRRSRPMRVFDVFGMIPPPSDRDGPDMQARYGEIAAGEATALGGQGRYYAYEEDLQSTVTNNFRALGYPIDQNNVTLLKGKVQDTLSVEGPVALAHIDVDWYEPVKACMDRIVPKLIVGGVVALRAYTDWSGCRAAADEYLETTGVRLERTMVAGQLFLKRL